VRGKSIAKGPEADDPVLAGAAISSSVDPELVETQRTPMLAAKSSSGGPEAAPVKAAVVISEEVGPVSSQTVQSRRQWLPYVIEAGRIRVSLNYHGQGPGTAGHIRSPLKESFTGSGAKTGWFDKHFVEFSKLSFDGDLSDANNMSVDLSYLEARRGPHQ
jgi:hypothetical protein